MQQQVTQFTVPKLYRHILKAARQFPSIKRDAIIEDIKTEFRESKSLSDPKVIKEKMAVAVRGLQELEIYTKLDKKSKEWTIHLRGMCP